MTDDTKRRTTYLANMSELRRLEDEVAAGFQAGVEQSAQNGDLDRNLVEWMTAIPRDDDVPPEAWNALETTMRLRLDAARITRAQQQEMLTLYLSTSQANMTSTATTASAVGAITIPSANTVNWPAPHWSTEQTRAFEALVGCVQSVFNQKDWLPEVITLIERLGADTPHPGSRSAPDHLRGAHLAFLQPPGGKTSPTQVLIELREGFDVLLDRLRYRLPHGSGQPKGSSTREKVMAIAERAGLQVFANAHFKTLAKDLELLRSELTPAKGSNMTREQIGDLLRRILYTLRIFLSSIDPNRLRPR